MVVPAKDNDASPVNAGDAGAKVPSWVKTAATCAGLAAKAWAKVDLSNAIWPLFSVTPMFLALPNEDEPAIEAKMDWISFVTFSSTADPINGPPVLVCALYPAFVWMSESTVLASSTRLSTAFEAADASGATVTVTGDVDAVRRFTVRPGSRPVTVFVWDWKA